MVSSLLRRLWPCAKPGLLFAALLTGQVQAQTPTPARPDPLDAKAPVPALRYEPSLAQFRRTGDEKPVTWRDANEAVARIGGWRVYAREAQQPDAATPAKSTAAPATPTAPAQPTPTEHDRHSGHKKP
jgi:hypothetical protein